MEIASFIFFVIGVFLIAGLIVGFCVWLDYKADLPYYRTFEEIFKNEDGSSKLKIPMPLGVKNPGSVCPTCGKEYK